MNKTVMLTVVSALLAASAVQAQDLNFTLFNNSEVAMTGFYVSDTGTDLWGENLIPENSVLLSGYEVEVVIADGRNTCEYDILIELQTGELLEDYDIDLCELQSYTIE